jgi:hypothetical protein
MKFQEIVDLVGKLAWPVTVLVVLVALRRELQSIMQAVRTRVADPETPVRITREGLELSARVETIEGNLEVQRLRANAIALATEKTGRTVGGVSVHLRDLRAEYLTIRDGDRDERTRRKNTIADQLGAAVLRENIQKEALADAEDEVWTLALSAAITALPAAGDDELLLRSGRNVRRLHVRYRVAAAFAQLSDSSLLSPALSDEVLALLGTYRESADPALLRRLGRTSRQVAIRGGHDGPS